MAFGRAGLELVIVGRALLLPGAAARGLGLHLGDVRGVVPRAVSSCAGAIFIGSCSRPDGHHRPVTVNDRHIFLPAFAFPIFLHRQLVVHPSARCPGRFSGASA